MSREFPTALSAAPRARTRGYASGALLASAGAVCIACTAPAPAPAPPDLAVTRAPVVGGEVSPAGGKEDAVLLMRTVVDNAEIVCTATLVADNLVITARHCVSHLTQGNFRCTVQGELVSDDPGAGDLGMHFDAAGLEFYDGKIPRTDPVAHGQSILSTLSDTICVNDIAFVVLDQEVALPSAPLRQKGRALPGEAVTLVGYGFDDAMANGDVLDVTTQQRTHNDHLTIADVGPVGDDGVTTAPPRSIVLEGPAGCIGDSGGPLFATATGAVLGVYSLLDGATCLAGDARNLFTDVPDFGVLAADAFDAAGAEPMPERTGSEPGASGAGQAGASGAGNENGEAGSAGAANVSSAGESAGGAAASGGGRAGASSTSAGGGGASGAPDDTASGGAAPNGAGFAGTPPASAAPRVKSKSGCAFTPGDARPPRWAWPLGLVAVLERIFRIGRRVRRRVRVRMGFRS